MITVASNDEYSITVDQDKNRIFFTMRGSWTDAKEVSDWLKDLESAIKLCKRGFTELIDWRELSGILLTDYIGKAQKMAIDAGLLKAARVYDRETFLKLQMDTLTERTGFPVKSFFNMKDAEAWLDAP
jgi:hypothetical protein